MPDWTRQVAENAERYRLLAERLSQLSITEVSGDGTVRVTVSASGQLTDLALRERWHPDPLPVVAAEIMDCLHRAQARIPDLLHRAMLDTVGGTDPSAHLLLAEAEKRFPEPPPREEHRSRGEPEMIRVEPEPEPAAPRVHTPQPRDEGDWDERPFMENL
jgi:YbaB/EbfC DNA-binding family